MDPELVVQQREIECDLMVHDLVSTAIRIRNKFRADEVLGREEDLLEAAKIIIEAVTEAKQRG